MEGKPIVGPLDPDSLTWDEKGKHWTLSIL